MSCISRFHWLFFSLAVPFHRIFSTSHDLFSNFPCVRVGGLSAGFLFCFWLFGLNAFLSDIGLVSWRETENPLENEMERIGGLGHSLFLFFVTIEPQGKLHGTPFFDQT